MLQRDHSLEPHEDFSCGNKMKCAICQTKFHPESRVVVLNDRIVCLVHTTPPTEPDIEAIKSLLGEHRAGLS